jgi:Protein of unknown function (DUF3617)
MNVAASKNAGFLALLLAVTAASSSAFAVDEIRGGKWEFTTEMRMPMAPPVAPGSQAAPGGNTPMTRTACISAANPVPQEISGNVRCRLDGVQRQGGTVTWSMTCIPPQGAPARSDGVAHYAGTTMEGTFTTHLTAPNGQTIASPGRITGRYIGACDGR